MNNKNQFAGSMRKRKLKANLDQDEDMVWEKSKKHYMSKLEGEHYNNKFKKKYRQTMYNNLKKLMSEC